MANKRSLVVKGSNKSFLKDLKAKNREGVLANE